VDPQGQTLPAALLPSDRRTLALQALLHAVHTPEASSTQASLSPFSLAIAPQLPPLGYASVFLTPAAREASSIATSNGKEASVEESFMAGAVQHLALPECAAESALREFAPSERALQLLPLVATAVDKPSPLHAAARRTIENKHLKLEFGGPSGGLQAVVLKQSGERVEVALDMVYWQSTRGGGAYIMRPSAQVCVLFGFLGCERLKVKDLLLQGYARLCKAMQGFAQRVLAQGFSSCTKFPLQSCSHTAVSMQPGVRARFAYHG
jgi:hypothetical protein